MPEWVLLTGMFFGVLLFGLAIGLIWADRRNQHLGLPAKGKTPTHLRLQMTPGSAVEVGKENIWYWYVLTFSRQKHFNKQKELIKDIPGHLIFVVFDKPVDMKQPIIECPGATFPFVEEKSRSTRHLVLDCTDEVTNKVLTLKLALHD